MKQIQLYRTNTYWYDEEKVIPASTWTEVTDEELRELYDAVQYANSDYNSGWRYHILERVDNFQEVFESAKIFTEKMKKEKAASEKRAADAKAKREATSLARKKKQLEKLKKELESD